jgi:processive 1,2-diacylglycerol beta-glucosyltransferase
MKVLIAYAGAGKGHQKAAEALQAYCALHRPDISVRLVDVLHYCSPFFRKVYSQGYSFLITQVPFLWKFLFWGTACRGIRSLLVPLVSKCNNSASKRFVDFLVTERFDAVISTHFLTSEIAASLKREGRITPRLATVITDFGVHPLWIQEGTDLYCVASTDTRDILESKHVPTQAILVTGIPVDERFSRTYDQQALRTRMGLAPDMCTVLLSTGSFGIGPFTKIIKKLQGSCQCIAVCAHNKRLYRQLQQAAFPHVKVLGFVDTMHELLAASDIIVAKPGGLTVAEALCSRVYPLFVTAIPGQETENLRILSSRGVGVLTHAPERIASLILEFHTTPALRSRFMAAALSLRKPNAAKDIIDALCTSDPRPAA